jgi:hypothetical protein
MYSLMSSWISAVLVAEEQLGERLRELGLADPGRAEEDERAARALRVLQARTGAADRPGERVDRVLLADDPLVQLVLHPQELGRLLLGELVDRDPGPVREHLGDDVLVDDVEELDAGERHSCSRAVLRSSLVCSLVGELLRLLEVLPLDGGVLLGADRRAPRRSCGTRAASTSGGSAGG